MKKVTKNKVLLKIDNLEKRLNETKGYLNNLEFDKKDIEGHMERLSFGMYLLGEMVKPDRDTRKTWVTISDDDTKKLTKKIDKFSDEVDEYRTQLESTQVAIDNEKVVVSHLMFAIQVLKEIVYEGYDAELGSDLL